MEWYTEFVATPDNSKKKEKKNRSEVYMNVTVTEASIGALEVKISKQSHQMFR